MTRMTGRLLIITGVVLAVAGGRWCGCHGRCARRGRVVRSFAGLSGALTCTSVACGVITGVQWAVLSQSGPGVAWAVVLWLPAFLAGATVARLFAVLRIVHGRRRRVRATRREAGVADDRRSANRVDPCRHRLGRRAAAAERGRNAGQGGGAPRTGDAGPAGRHWPGAGVAAADRNQCRGRGRAGGHARADARCRPLAGPQHGALPRHRRVRAGEALVGGAHERPLRAADARCRSGRGLRAAHRLGTARGTGPRTAAPPPDGLDHRAAGPGPRRRGCGSGRDRVPARVGRGAGHRPPGRGVAAHPRAEGRRRHRVGGVVARCDLAGGRGGAAGAGAGRAVAGRAAARQRAPLGRPGRRRQGAPDRDRHPGRGRGRARALGYSGDEPGGQGRLAGRVRHPTGAGERARLPDHVLAAHGRDPGDDRRQAGCAGPQPGPRALGGVAQRGRAGRLRGSVGGRSGLDRAAGPAVSAAVSRAPQTCSPGCRWGCRSAGT